MTFFFQERERGIENAVRKKGRGPAVVSGWRVTYWHIIIFVTLNSTRAPCKFVMMDLMCWRSRNSHILLLRLLLAFRAANGVFINEREKFPEIFLWSNNCHRFRSHKLCQLIFIMRKQFALLKSILFSSTIR